MEHQGIMGPANQLWEMLVTWFAKNQWLLHYLLCSEANVALAGGHKYLFLTKNMQGYKWLDSGLLFTSGF